MTGHVLKGPVWLLYQPWTGVDKAVRMQRQTQADQSEGAGANQIRDASSSWDGRNAVAEQYITEPMGVLARVWSESQTQMPDGAKLVGSASEAGQAQMEAGETELRSAPP